MKCIVRIFPSYFSMIRGQYSIVHAFWHYRNGNVHINYTFTQIEIALSVDKWGLHWCWIKCSMPINTTQTIMCFLSKLHFVYFFSMSDLWTHTEEFIYIFAVTNKYQLLCISNIFSHDMMAGRFLCWRWFRCFHRLLTRINSIPPLPI